GYRGIALNEAEAAANSPVPSWSQALSVCFWSTVPCLVLHFLVVPFSLTRRFPHGPSPRSHGRLSPLAETQPGHPAALPVLRTPLRCLLHALPRRTWRSRGSPVPPPSDRRQTPVLRGLSANLRRAQVPLHGYVESSLGSRTHSVSQTTAPALARGIAS